MITIPQIGDTIKLKVKFYSWDGSPIDADGDVTLTVYDKEEEEIDEITSGIDHLDTGEYQYDYTIPEGFGYLVYEFSCDIGGNPATRRGKIQRTWDD
ncbi:MAG: hypothetical protein ACLFT4_08060 [Bacteroidales bacterium]